ncbi:Clostridium P-47 protein [Bordetella ansorpii]|uniref:Clostridium P-47 protein n=1 Tax=Bordetella ansorpii TaxID=288768 RepID=A0A157NSU6_9BORD|nr:TULIP family P47-like protein [Bordetella ansorpii]SAI24288.1 Clostridium P-47 protein [Bordetella ansorpii]
MTDSPINPSACLFPTPDSLTNATLGWDAVYAIKYSTLNRALSASAWPPAPWTQGGDIDLKGANNNGRVDKAIVTNVQLATGGSGAVLRWRLRVDANRYQRVGGPSLAGPFSFDLVVRTTLAFTADAGQDDLLHLHVQTRSDAQADLIESLTLDMATLPAPFMNSFEIFGIERELISIVKAPLQRHLAALLDAMPLSTVLSQDLARKAGVTWLQPEDYQYATADLPDADDGILAVLVRSEDTRPIEANVLAQAIPTNPGLDAAIIISPDAVTRSTFLRHINTTLDKSLSGKFKPKGNAGEIANDSPIKLKYRRDATGEYLLVPPQALADPHAETFDAEIPAGRLVFRIADDAITVDTQEIRVTLSAGGKLVLSMRERYRLAINPDTQSLDLAPEGTPSVSISFDAACEAAEDGTVRQVVAIIGGLILGELDAYAANAIQSMHASAASGHPPRRQQDVLAALRQSETEGMPVCVDIGLGRELVIERRSAQRMVYAHPAEPVPLSGQYQATPARRNAGNGPQRIYIETRPGSQGAAQPAALVLSQIAHAEPERGPVTSDAAELELSAEVIAGILTKAKQPWNTYVKGLLIYAVSLAAGTGLGNLIGNVSGRPEDRRREARARAGALQSTLGGAAAGQPLLGGISFPMLDRYKAGAQPHRSPLHEQVLKCASVNGGLVLGLSLT